MAFEQVMHSVSPDPVTELAPVRAAPERAPSIRWPLRAAAAGALALVGIAASEAGSVDAPYEIADWQGFRDAAISYTFDDGVSNQFAVAQPMFDEAGFKMTLFSVTEASWAFPGWEALQAAADAGHEIASHSESHTSLGPLGDPAQTQELQGSKDSIDANVSGQRCLTFAYPNCVTGNDALVSTHYIAARICSQQIVSKTPSNFMRISSLICGTQGAVKTPGDFETTGSQAASTGGWAVYLIHGIDDDGGYSPLPSATLQASVDYFAANPETFWVDTFSNVVRYIRERDDATVEEVSETADRIVLQVTDSLDDATYDRAITLRRPLPQDWKFANATQGDAPVAAYSVSDDGVDYLVFDVVPDRGAVTIERVDPQPELTIRPGASAGVFQLQLDDPTGARYQIDSASDLADWTPLQAESISAPASLDVELTDEPRYFRATAVE